MKVIVAGFAKTGTKSMHIALTELGYEVYDFVENFWYLGKDWNKILTEGGSVDDFKRMYKDVDATIDTPVYFFWKEIHEAFPDAKIVFTAREEDSWFPSYRKQTEEMEKNTIFRLIFVYSPLGRKLGALIGKMKKLCRVFRDLLCVTIVEEVVLATSISNPSTFYWRLPVNEMVMRRLYRQDYADVIQNAPKDKLLVYNVKEGWEPLCKFLDKPVPDKQFLHANIGGKLFDELMQKHPVMQRMVKEAFVIISLLAGLGVFGVYKFYRFWPYLSFNNLYKLLNFGQV
ncbi:uncharacterized protein LOC143463388 [Clavelina lepadiformis]|uniref:uncharacterized protein LOC143463388 n=1 Tax=Clavelina lepadiformis TaxID=159417 RepID=UPI0040430F57